MKLLAPTSVLRLVDSVAILLAQAMQLARARVASQASPVLRLMAQRDHATGETELLRRELEILRAQRAAMPPHRRPDYGPMQRLAIIQLMRLRGWSIATVAQRFVLHANTVRSWTKAVEGRGNLRFLTPAFVWNRIDDAVRWAVHELRRLCPEPEFGTRTIARHLIRAGIQLSRSTAQRVLRESYPVQPRPQRPAMEMAAGVEPYHLLTPGQPNQVWHLDLTTLRILWWRFTVAAILDGCTRRLLALRVYARTPCSKHLAALVRRTARAFGPPRFLISDHGSQFRKRFAAALKRLGTKHVRGRVRAPFLNGKCERMFRTFRTWWRFALPALTIRRLQGQLDIFRGWYNEQRVHAALNGGTHAEAWRGETIPPPVTFRACDHLEPEITISRRSWRGDPRLPILDLPLRAPRGLNNLRGTFNPLTFQKNTARRPRLVHLGTRPQPLANPSRSRTNCPDKLLGPYKF